MATFGGLPASRMARQGALKRGSHGAATMPAM